MGYQESYVTTKNPALFNDLVKRIQSLGKNYYKSWDAEPVEIITLKQSINGNCTYQFEEGTRFVYIVGQRSIQRSVCNVLNTSLDDDLVKQTDLYFTEYFPSEQIFLENSDLAMHQKWEWE